MALAHGKANQFLEGSQVELAAKKHYQQARTTVAPGLVDWVISHFDCGIFACAIQARLSICERTYFQRFLHTTFSGAN